ncbi:MAG: NAD(P)H-dependent oxidoreductase [Deferribacteraceae bacterium]|jgi:multimeric flavodoxin WrbA|nr:NAD(P)H-dependent oxidoreductase [Deferribacteraceae bacterium]
MLIIETSFRSSNGAYLANFIAEKYPSARRIRLADMVFSGCRACKQCKGAGADLCVIDDDLSPIMASLLQEKQIVLIAPNYMGFMAGEAKLFIDRLYCMRDSAKKSRFAEGTKLAFFLTQGSGNRASGELCLGWLKSVCEHHMIKFYGHTIANCAEGNNDGVRIKQEEIAMNLGFFF